MKKDAVDDILEQWSEERPELDTSSLGVVVRVMSLNRAFLRQVTEALAPLDMEQFEYDAVGNFKTFKHQFANGSWTREYAYNETSLIDANKKSLNQGFIGFRPKAVLCCIVAIWVR